jgi:hypothetical protein
VKSIDHQPEALTQRAAQAALLLYWCLSFPLESVAGMRDKACRDAAKPPSRAIQEVLASIAAYPFGEPEAAG